MQTALVERGEDVAHVIPLIRATVCLHSAFCILNFELRDYRFTLRSLSALPTTETELILIAAAANIGLRSTPKNG